MLSIFGTRVAGLCLLTACVQHYWQCATVFMVLIWISKGNLSFRTRTKDQELLSFSALTLLLMILGDLGCSRLTHLQICWCLVRRQSFKVGRKKPPRSYS